MFFNTDAANAFYLRPSSYPVYDVAPDLYSTSSGGGHTVGSSNTSRQAAAPHGGGPAAEAYARTGPAPSPSQEAYLHDSSIAANRQAQRPAQPPLPSSSARTAAAPPLVFSTAGNGGVDLLHQVRSRASAPALTGGEVWARAAYLPRPSRPSSAAATTAGSSRLGTTAETGSAPPHRAAPSRVLRMPTIAELAATSSGAHQRPSSAPAMRPVARGGAASDGVLPTATALRTAGYAGQHPVLPGHDSGVNSFDVSMNARRDAAEKPTRAFHLPSAAAPAARVFTVSQAVHDSYEPAANILAEEEEEEEGGNVSAVTAHGSSRHSRGSCTAPLSAIERQSDASGGANGAAYRQLNAAGPTAAARGASGESIVVAPRSTAPAADGDYDTHSEDDGQQVWWTVDVSLTFLAGYYASPGEESAAMLEAATTRSPADMRVLRSVQCRAPVLPPDVSPDDAWAMTEAFLRCVALASVDGTATAGAPCVPQAYYYFDLDFNQYVQLSADTLPLASTLIRAVMVAPGMEREAAAEDSVASRYPSDGRPGSSQHGPRPAAPRQPAGASSSPVRWQMQGSPNHSANGGDGRLPASREASGPPPPRHRRLPLERDANGFSPVPVSPVTPQHVRYEQQQLQYAPPPPAGYVDEYGRLYRLAPSAPAYYASQGYEEEGYDEGLVESGDYGYDAAPVGGYAPQHPAEVWDMTDFAEDGGDEEEEEELAALIAEQQQQRLRASYPAAPRQPRFHHVPTAPPHRSTPGALRSHVSGRLPPPPRPPTAPTPSAAQPPVYHYGTTWGSQSATQLYPRPPPPRQPKRVASHFFDDPLLQRSIATAGSSSAGVPPPVPLQSYVLGSGMTDSYTSRGASQSSALTPSPPRSTPPSHLAYRPTAHLYFDESTAKAPSVEGQQQQGADRAVVPPRPASQPDPLGALLRRSAETMRLRARSGSSHASPSQSQSTAQVTHLEPPPEGDDVEASRHSAQRLRSPPLPELALETQVGDEDAAGEPLYSAVDEVERLASREEAENVASGGAAAPHHELAAAPSPSPPVAVLAESRPSPLPIQYDDTEAETGVDDAPPRPQLPSTKLPLEHEAPPVVSEPAPAGVALEEQQSTTPAVSQFDCTRSEEESSQMGDATAVMVTEAAVTSVGSSPAERTPADDHALYVEDGDGPAADGLEAAVTSPEHSHNVSGASAVAAAVESAPHEEKEEEGMHSTSEDSAVPEAQPIPASAPSPLDDAPSAAAPPSAQPTPHEEELPTAAAADDTAAHAPSEASSIVHAETPTEADEKAEEHVPVVDPVEEQPDSNPAADDTPLPDTKEESDSAAPAQQEEVAEPLPPSSPPTPPAAVEMVGDAPPSVTSEALEARESEEKEGSAQRDGLHAVDEVAAAPGNDTAHAAEEDAPSRDGSDDNDAADAPVHPHDHEKDEEGAQAPDAALDNREADTSTDVVPSAPLPLPRGSVELRADITVEDSTTSEGERAAQAVPGGGEEGGEKEGEDVSAAEETAEANADAHALPASVSSGARDDTFEESANVQAEVEVVAFPAGAATDDTAGTLLGPLTPPPITLEGIVDDEPERDASNASQLVASASARSEARAQASSSHTPAATNDASMSASEHRKDDQEEQQGAEEEEKEADPEPAAQSTSEAKAEAEQPTEATTADSTSPDFTTAPECEDGAAEQPSEMVAAEVAAAASQSGSDESLVVADAPPTAADVAVAPKEEEEEEEEEEDSSSQPHDTVAFSTAGGDSGAAGAASSDCVTSPPAAEEGTTDALDSAAEDDRDTTEGVEHATTPLPHATADAYSGMLELKPIQVEQFQHFQEDQDAPPMFQRSSANLAAAAASMSATVQRDDVDAPPFLNVAIAALTAAHVNAAAAAAAPPPPPTAADGGSNPADEEVSHLNTTTTTTTHGNDGDEAMMDAPMNAFRDSLSMTHTPTYTRRDEEPEDDTSAVGTVSAGDVAEMLVQIAGSYTSVPSDRVSSNVAADKSRAGMEASPPMEKAEGSRSGTGGLSGPSPLLPPGDADTFTQVVTEAAWGASVGAIPVAAASASASATPVPHDASRSDDARGLAQAGSHDADAPSLSLSAQPESEDEMGHTQQHLPLLPHPAASTSASVSAAAESDAPMPLSLSSPIPAAPRNENAMKKTLVLLGFPGSAWEYIITYHYELMHEAFINDAATAANVPIASIQDVRYSKGSLMVDLYVLHPATIDEQELQDIMCNYEYPRLWALYEEKKRERKRVLHGEGGGILRVARQATLSAQEEVKWSPKS